MSHRQDIVSRLIAEALAIEAEEAKEAGALGYMARSMVQATLPHRSAPTTQYTRTNGTYTLVISAHPKIGLPYGSIPRLLLAWIGTEAVKSQDHVLVLSDSLSGFMRQLDLVPTGGRWGSITRLKEQVRRLFSCSVSCLYEGESMEAMKNFVIASETQFWWQPKNPDQASLFDSTITLSDSFFLELANNPVPVDLRALKALKQSPLALDIYCWLTYRMSYLKQQTEIPWQGLQGQFGGDYTRTRDFKRKFLEALKRVEIVYPALNVDEGKHGLKLRPGKPHVKKVQKVPASA